MGLAVAIILYYTFCVIYLSAILFPIILLIFFRKRFSLKNVLKIYFFVIVPVLLFWFMISKPLFWPDIDILKLERTIDCPMESINFGPDPLVPGTEITGSYITGPSQVYKIWEKRFWNKKVDLAKCKGVDAKKALKHQRDVRLQTNMDNPKLIGWSVSTTKFAFGEPEKIEEKDGMERWIYYPWEEKGPWSVSIYVKDGKIYKIVGD
ncbi:MAG: hypothetical protein ABH832_00285 [bacterium]